MAETLPDDGVVGLTQVPLPALHLIWRHLGRQQQHGESPCKAIRDQLHLRSTCKAMRDASTAFITSLLIDVECVITPSAFHAAMQAAMSQLAGFPAGATMKTLHWQQRLHDDHGESTGVDGSDGVTVSDEGSASASDDEREEPDAAPGQMVGGGEDSAGVQEGEAAFERLHDLLPQLLHSAACRFLAVIRVTIHSQLGLSCRELSSVVDACPALQDLSLLGVHLSSAAILAPLSRLRRLVRLDFKDVSCSDGAGATFEALTALSGLTSLTFRQEQRFMRSSADLLCHVSRLPGLQELRLLLDAWTPQCESNLLGQHVVRSLAPLSHLTNFVGLHAHLPPPHDCAMACTPCLAELLLPTLVLGTPAIRWLAALPCLTSLLAAELDPDTDLSGLLSRWHRLELDICSYRQLLLLPVQAVRELHVPNHVWVLDGTQELDVLCAEVRTAAAILARTAPSPSSLLHLTLNWDRRRMISARCGATRLPPWPAEDHLVLAALAALAPLARLTLCLAFGSDMQVGAEHAQQLQQHLPYLHTLSLHWWQDHFISFVRALAAGRCCCPRVLTLVGADEPFVDVNGRPLINWPASVDHEQALLCLGSSRVRSGDSLVVADYGRLGDRGRLNEVMEAAARAAGRACRVHFVHSLTDE